MRVYEIKWSRRNWSGSRLAESCGRNQKEAIKYFKRSHEKPDTIKIIDITLKRNGGIKK